MGMEILFLFCQTFQNARNCMLQAAAPFEKDLRSCGLDSSQAASRFFLAEKTVRQLAMNPDRNFANLFQMVRRLEAYNFSRFGKSDRTETEFTFPSLATPIILRA